MEEGTLTQELFQQFPPCSSAAKGEPAAACALPAGAGSPPHACPSLEQTPAVRSGQGHRHGDFPEPVPSPVSTPQLRLCPAFVKRGLCQGHRDPARSGRVPRVGNAPCPGESHPQCQTQQHLSRGWATTPHHDHSACVSHVGEGGTGCVCIQRPGTPDVVTAAPGACKKRCHTRNLLQPSKRQRHQFHLTGE